MDETAHGKTVMRPVELIGSDGALTHGPTGPAAIPWAEILGDDNRPKSDPGFMADASTGVAVSEPGRFASALPLAGALQEEGLPWAEIVPDDLGYMRESEQSEVPFLNAQAGEASEALPPWAEILGGSPNGTGTLSKSQHVPQVVSRSEQAGKEVPYQWYHEPSPIPVPIMPIALFQLVIFVLFW